MRSIARTRRVQQLGLWFLDDQKLRWAVYETELGKWYPSRLLFETLRCLPLIGPRSLTAKQVANLFFSFRFKILKKLFASFRFKILRKLFVSFRFKILKKLFASFHFKLKKKSHEFD